MFDVTCIMVRTMMRICLHAGTLVMLIIIRVGMAHNCDFIMKSYDYDTVFRIFLLSQDVVLDLPKSCNAQHNTHTHRTKHTPEPHSHPDRPRTNVLYDTRYGGGPQVPGGSIHPCHTTSKTERQSVHAHHASVCGYELLAVVSRWRVCVCVY